MAFEIFYAICSRLVYCPDLQSTGKIFGKKTEAGAEAQFCGDRDSGSGRSDLAALFPGFQTDPGCHDVLPGAATAI